ncbi:MAG: FtsX-like permease family protein [Anaerolineae bacterium]|nr:FtsX-like permease family protein [Anaerolineae bacterium]
MLRPRWRKVLRDLWLNKIRTVLVVLSIAVGVFAVGTIFTSQIILSRDLTEAYLATNPASATFFTFDSFGEPVVEAVENMDEVKEAEGRRRVTVRVKTGPEEWRLLYLIAIPDFDEVEIDKFSPEAGAWPPPNNTVLIERASLGLLQAGLGDTLLIRTPEGKERQMPISGLAHDLNAQLYVFDGTSYGFITTDTLEWLGQPTDYNELRIIVADHADDRDHIREVANEVQDKIENGGRSVLFTLIPQPGKSPLDFLIQAIVILMGALALMSLLLSGFLVINTISALLAQQVRQIGIMKAIGARTRQVVGMYLVTVIIFGLLALLLAVPLGAAGAYFFSRFIAGFLNFDVTTFQLPPDVLLAEIAVGLVVPLLAGLYPIMAGVRITVREAISTYGLGKGQFGSRRFDRWLLAVQQRPFLRRNLSRPLLLSLRNTFRRKTRLALTLLTLIFGGVIFITVFSLRVSMLATLDSWLAYFRWDVAVQFERDYRIERILREVLDTPGVVEAETWGFASARRKRPDGSDSDNIVLYAPPAATKMARPTVIEGRWLQPADTNAVVVNSIILRDEPDVQVGSYITLKIEGEEETWRVVGVVTGGFPVAVMFANYPYFARVVGEVGQAQWVFATTQEHTLDYQNKVVRALEARFEHIGFDVGATAKVAEERSEVVAIFEVIVVLLLIMAVLIAVIGGLGLMGTMSINVLERTREIGVMRAIGAPNGAVRRVFIIEGIIIGVLSWLVGAVLAYPISKFLSDLVGQQFLSAPLDYTFSINGVLLWLVVVVVLSAVASFLPAWNASRLTVREVLAYE